MGLLLSWVDRKTSARLQWRVGPPWYQGFLDILKLSGKETILPESAGWVFLAVPYLGFLSLGLASAIIGSSIFFPGASFLGDIIVVVYVLTMPAIALIIGASSSGNPLAAVGASREMKLALAYELPFLLSVIAVVVRSGISIRLNQVLGHQALYGSNIFSYSGALAFICAIFCIQAKIGLPPFDISEAEQEIMAGVLIEYSGLPLAIFKLSKAMLLYVMPLFLTVLFLGGNVGPAMVALKVAGIVLLLVLIKNTNPRLRIDQALRFFWGPVTLLALVSLVLAAIGL
jgi:NADH-quinone oxidoreductase subunit H